MYLSIFNKCTLLYIRWTFLPTLGITLFFSFLCNSPGVGLTMNRLFQARFCTHFRHLPSKQHFSNRNALLSLRTILTPAKPSAPSEIPHRSLSNGPSTIVPAKTWVDRLPVRVRPYIYLTRIDKPIGTLLLFYPCGVFYCLSLVTETHMASQHGRSQWLHTRWSSHSPRP